MKRNREPIIDTQDVNSVSENLTGSLADQVESLKKLPLFTNTAIAGALIFGCAGPLLVSRSLRDSGEAVRTVSLAVDTSNDVDPLTPEETPDPYSRHRENVPPYGEIIVAPKIEPDREYTFDDIAGSDGSGFCDPGLTQKDCLGYVVGPHFGAGAEIVGFTYNPATGRYTLDPRFVPPTPNGAEPPSFVPTGK
jgi:hypothetical protein